MDAINVRWFNYENQKFNSEKIWAWVRCGRDSSLYLELLQRGWGSLTLKIKVAHR